MDGSINKIYKLKQLGGKNMAEKTYYCIDCNREIKHKGRCLACNMKAKKRKEAQDRKY